MKKRICPGCKTPWYSANEGAEFWECAYCHAEIPITVQEDCQKLEEVE